jgi:hypothetical protein
MAVLAASLMARVAVAEGDSYAVDAGWGLLATVTNVVYMPAKIVYGLLGGLVGALTLGVTGGDIDTAKGVWSPTLGGHYVVTASMLRGEEPLLFVGPSYYKSCEPVAAQQWTDSARNQ